jgi:hypothetical protein
LLCEAVLQEFQFHILWVYRISISKWIWHCFFYDGASLLPTNNLLQKNRSQEHLAPMGNPWSTWLFWYSFWELMMYLYRCTQCQDFGGEVFKSVLMQIPAESTNNGKGVLATPCRHFGVPENKHPWQSQPTSFYCSRPKFSYRSKNHIINYIF